MKKSRIFMASGALVLAISAIFATKANKKFTAGFHTAVEHLKGGLVFAAGSAIFTASTGGNLANAYAAVVTNLGAGITSKIQLYTSVQGEVPVTYVP